MTNLESMADDFKTRYEAFVQGCTALEADGLWDTLSAGDIVSYYYTDLMSVILCLVAADGRYAPEEADYVNRVFGVSYTADDLAEIMRTEFGNLDRLFRDEVPAGYRILQAASIPLAARYKELLLLACEIIARSDNVVHPDETKLIKLLGDSLSC